MMPAHCQPVTCNIFSPRTCNFASWRTVFYSKQTHWCQVFVQKTLMSRFKSPAQLH